MMSQSGSSTSTVLVLVVVPRVLLVEYKCTVTAAAGWYVLASTGTSGGTASTATLLVLVVN
jgi:hypothetical protein